MATFTAIGLYPEWNAPRLEQLRTSAPIPRGLGIVSPSGQVVLWSNRLIAPAVGGEMPTLADGHIVARLRSSGQGWPQ